jgi:hypothetical protein
MPPGLDGWSSAYGREPDGSFRSEERVNASRPVVDPSERGARLLGDRYWREVMRVSGGVVRRRTTEAGVELRLLGRGPRLLQFGPAETQHDPGAVRCRYPIRGGMLARRPGGSICLSQTGGDEPQLSTVVSGFVPRLGPRFERIQHRLHVAVSRRYFRRLLAEAGRQ